MNILSDIETHLYKSAFWTLQLESLVYDKMHTKNLGGVQDALKRGSIFT